MLSLLRPFCRRGLRTSPRKRTIQIDGGLFCCVLEAHHNFGIAEASLPRETIGGRLPFPKHFFDNAPKITPDTFQVARDAGLMLTKMPANIREGLFLGVIQAEPFGISRIQARQSHIQRTAEYFQVALAMRIGRRFQKQDSARLETFPHCFAVVQGSKTPAGADGIDMALREHGAQPGFQ
jgi:hypothetical protein